ncbi:MAG: histidine phosphatase family protein [Dehalococcoidia bacterium]|nr:histidine phosphatase family protein [Dehalococcoidia bacterium]
MSRLLLARHGNTKGNSAERFWGQTDVELSAEGTWQVERLADRLAGENIASIYSSKLCRASATAEIIASHHQQQVITCPELLEINFGKVEGLSFNEIGERYPELVRDWPTRDPSFRFPEGESVIDLDHRVVKFLGRLEKHTPEDTVLVVAHAGVLRLLICHLLPIDIRHWRQLRTDLASLSIVVTSSQGAVLHLLNDTSHLH